MRWHPCRYRLFCANRCRCQPLHLRLHLYLHRCQRLPQHQRLRRRLPQSSPWKTPPPLKCPQTAQKRRTCCKRQRLRLRLRLRLSRNLRHCPRRNLNLNLRRCPNLRRNRNPRQPLSQSLSRSRNLNWSPKCRPASRACWLPLHHKHRLRPPPPPPVRRSPALCVRRGARRFGAVRRCGSVCGCCVCC